MIRRFVIALAQLALLAGAVVAMVILPQDLDRDRVEAEAHDAVAAQVTQGRDHLLALSRDQLTDLDTIPPWQPVLDPGQSYLVLGPDEYVTHVDGPDGQLRLDRTLRAHVHGEGTGTERTPVQRVVTESGPAYVGIIEVAQTGTAGLTAHVIVEPLAAELAWVAERTRDRAMIAVPIAGLVLLVWVLRPAFQRRTDRAPAARAQAGARPATALRDPSPASSSGSGRDSAWRPLGAVVIEGFGSRLAFGLVTFALPLYAYDLGMSLGAIGLLLATNVAVSVVLKPFMGVLIDHIGVRRSYIIAVILRTAVLVTLVLATDPIHLFLARGLHGVSIALRDPASSTVLAALGGKKSVAQRFAWYQTVKTFAGSGGQFSAGILLTALAGSYTSVFLIATVLSGLPLIVVLTALRGPLLEGLRLPQPPPRTPLPTDLRRALLPYAGLGAMMTGTAYLMANLLPILAVEYMGLSVAAAGSLYLVKTVVSLTGPAWGWLADRVSLRIVLGVRALGNCLSSLIWLVLPTYAGLMAGKIADDVGKAAFAPAWGAIMADVSDLDPARRGRVMAWMSSAEDAGEMAGPIVAGVIWTTFGLPALLITRATLAIITEVYAVVVGRRVRLRERSVAEDVRAVAPS